MICVKCKSSIADESLFCNFCGKKQISEARKELKRPNGFGTIVKLQGRRRRPYAVVVTDSIVNDKQKRRYVSYHETLKEARLAQNKELIQPSTSKSNIKFSELFNEWIETNKFKNISRQTQDNYRAAFTHLKPLHNMKFSEIRTGNMEQIINNLDKSHSTKTKVKLLCGLLFKYALENDIVYKNYAEFIELEKEENTKKENEIFTLEERKKILNSDNETGADIVIILLYTGLRINELLNLKKENIDFENGTITGGLKTEAGRERIIPIHPTAEPYLKNRYENATSDLIFTKADGRPLTDKYFRTKVYYPLLKKLDIEKRALHKTRHTFATILAESGVDTLAIKEILGHEDYAFTANKYTHTDVKYLAEQIRKIK